MEYNLSFDYAAAIILLILIVALSTVYYTDTDRTKLFRMYTICSLVNAILDIITAYTISYAEYVPDALNIVLNTLYQCSSIVSVSYGVLYFYEYCEARGDKNLLIDRLIRCFYFGMLALNMLFGYMFTFTGHEYVHGPLFLAAYIVPFILVAHAWGNAIYNCKKYELSKLLLTFIFLAVPIACGIMQAIIGSVTLVAFGEALCALIMIFSLETPEYRKLTQTLFE